MNALPGYMPAVMRVTALILKGVTGVIKQCHVSDQDTPINISASVLTFCNKIDKDGGSENISLLDRPCDGIIPRETEQLITTLSTTSGM